MNPKKRKAFNPFALKNIYQIQLNIFEKFGGNKASTRFSHYFRHTHTSLLAEAGVGLEEIMDRLGHQDDEVTRNVYLHVTNEMKRDASDKFCKLMRGLK